MALQQSSWLPWADKNAFDEASLRVDLERIVAFYREHGYFDARVAETEIERGDGFVDIVIAIDEGRPTRIAKLEIGGLGDVEPALRRALHAALPIKEGEVFDYPRFAAAQAMLLDALRRHGYAYAKSGGHALVDRERHTAVVELSALPGPLVHVGAIRVEGSDGLPLGPILHSVTFAPGALYSPREMARSEARIYELGVFSSVVLKLPDAPVATADVTIVVVPSTRLRELRLGGGVGIERQREEARLHGEWIVHNFLGGMRTLDVTLKPAYVVVPSLSSAVTQGLAAESDLRLTQPDFLHSAATANTRIGYDLGFEEGYQYRGPRGEVGLERSFWRDYLLLAASWNLQHLTFFNINEAVFNPLATPLGLGFRTSYRLVYLQEFAAVDLRDNRVEPREGAYLLVNFEQGLPVVGGDFRYVTVAPDLRGYLPLGARMVLALRALAGGLFSRPSTADSPITRRFFLGGPSSQRGFSYGRLAPQVLDPESGRRIPIGGDGEVLFSGELRIGVARLWNRPLQLVAFVDAGDVTARAKDLRLASLHVAVGPDLVYQTPVGPLRAGFGIRLNRLSGLGPGGLPNPDPGQRLAFHISLGEAF